MGVYPSYLFKEHDPVIDAVMTLIKDSHVSRSFIQTKSGVTTQTISNWENRKTKRPQFATINAVVRSLGAEIKITNGSHEVRIGRKRKGR